jgi:hypothetical protein
MLNAIILLLGGITLGVLLASTLGSGIYQSVEFGVGRNKVLAQTNSQTGAIRLCEPVRYSRDVDLSRFDAAPCARLSHLSFESDRAFPTQC